MRLLVVSATEREAQSISEWCKPMKSNSKWVKSYFYENATVDVLVTGAGIVPTTYVLGRLLMLYSYDLAINIGLAGSFKKEYLLGSVVNVVEDRFSELGAEDDGNFIPIGDMNLPGYDDYPFEDGMLHPDEPDDVDLLNEIAHVKGITVNTVHGNVESIKDVVEQYDPDVETMEGAAFFYCCMRSKLACLQIRAISNIVEKRNKDNWQIEPALDNLSTTVGKFIKEVSLSFQGEA